MEWILTTVFEWLVTFLLFSVKSALAITLLAGGLYIYYTWNFNFFKSRGLPGPVPKPVLGTVAESVTKNGSFHQAQIELYKKYGKVYGIFESRRPVYMISDPNIIKQIMIKDFTVFVNHRISPLLGPFKLFAFFARDHDWRRIRSLLTPTFTSGKMRQMNGQINGAVDDLVTNMEIIADGDGKIDAKSMFGAYVMDVIASVAFGIKTNSQKDANDPFVVEAKKAAFSSFDLTNPLFMIVFFIPEIVPIVEWFKNSNIPKSTINFFRSVIDSAIAMRKENPKCQKADFLQLMIDAHKMQANEDSEKDTTDDGLTKSALTKGLTNEEIFANSFGFFLAGYDNVANAMGFLLLILSTHPEVQDKLQKEVDESMEEGAKPTYDSVQKMPYLDMCLSETLRMFPPLALDRQASRDTTIDGIFIRKGMLVSFPVYAIHHDPEVWPEPFKFDPERFTPEAKAARNPYTYLPWGHGPRACLGMRLAQMEMKMAIIKLVHKFRFLPSENAQVPIKLRNHFVTEPELGFELKIARR